MKHIDTQLQDKFLKLTITYINNQFLSLNSAVYNSLLKTSEEISYKNLNFSFIEIYIASTSTPNDLHFINKVCLNRWKDSWRDLFIEKIMDKLKMSDVAWFKDSGEDFIVIIYAHYNDGTLLV
jgi:hypothetical protein